MEFSFIYLNKTILIIAALRGNKEIFDFLLSKGNFDLNEKDIFKCKKIYGILKSNLIQFEIIDYLWNLILNT